MEAWWKTWTDVNNYSHGKRVVLYGRSEDWIPKTLKKVVTTPDYIVDRNPIYHGTTYNEIDVVAPKYLLADTKNEIYIVITSGVYEGIIAFLVEHGFEAGRDFCCCPEYQDFYLLDEMRNYEKNVIVSCSDYHDNTMTRYSRAGGGIYNYHIGPNELSLLVKGSFRQLIQARDVIYAVEFVECKLYKFDKQFNVIDKFTLDEANFCGVDYDLKRDLIVLVNAKSDTVSLYKAADFSLVERVEFSEKNKRDKVTSQHHLNDVCIDGDYIYVSYFSHSGNWKKNIHDGGVSEFHIERMSEGSVKVVTDLWKPHSPKIINGELCYLDSMRGKFYTGNQTLSGEFHGFARGLAYDDRFYYIGQSEDMYMSKRFNISNNIMLNAGFYLFDLETKASRFYPMLDNMNIHDLMILKGEDDE
jgi:hypothetical protein